MAAKYINPFTDFGFKKLFGEEASKYLLIDFLNQMLPSEHQIESLVFKNNEQLGHASFERKAIYDLYCENQKGEKFIVELQKSKHVYFKDRTVYYATFPIQEQAQKGDWNYRLEAIYCIGILDFVFHEDKNRQEYYHTVKLKDQNNQIFYDKLTFIYIEMPNFNKTEQEITTHFDKWLYFLKHLEDIEQIPNILKEQPFEQAFNKAAMANMNPDEITRYQGNLKTYRDLKGVVETAHMEGLEEGRLAGKLEGLEEGLLAGELKGKLEGRREGKLEGRLEGRLEGKLEIARALQKTNMPLETILELTGLSADDLK